jgi:hypothetical protein
VPRPRQGAGGGLEDAKEAKRRASLPLIRLSSIPPKSGLPSCRLVALHRLDRRFRRPFTSRECRS